MIAVRVAGISASARLAASGNTNSCGGTDPGTPKGWFHTLWGTLVRSSAGAKNSGGARQTLFMARGRRLPPRWPPCWVNSAGGLSAFGAHAYDLHRHGGDPLLAPKLDAAKFVHTTTQTNVDDLQRRFPGRRVEIILSRRGLLRLPVPPVRVAGAGIEASFCGSAGAEEGARSSRSRPAVNSPGAGSRSG